MQEKKMSRKKWTQHVEHRKQGKEYPAVLF